MEQQLDEEHFHIGYCILCLNPILKNQLTISVNQDSSQTISLDSSQHSVLYVLLRLLKVSIPLYLKWDIVNDTVPFCNKCMTSANEIVDLQEQINAIEEKINGCLQNVIRCVKQSNHGKVISGSLGQQDYKNKSFRDFRRLILKQHCLLDEQEQNPEVDPVPVSGMHDNPDDLVVNGSSEQSTLIRKLGNLLHVDAARAKNVESRVKNTRRKSSFRRKHNGKKIRSEKTSGRKAKIKSQSHVEIETQDEQEHIGFNLCGACGKSFPTERCLHQHMSRVHNDVILHCRICNRPYKCTSGASLKNHEWTHMNADEQAKALIAGHGPPKIKPKSVSMENRKWKCQHCGKIFDYKHNMLKHEETHQSRVERKSHMCQKCGKLYMSEDALRQHIRLVHETDKLGTWFECSVCQMKFPQRTRLKKHVRIHTGEKPFVCSICCKAFSQSSQLKLHEITHTDRRPFACDECCKTYRAPHQVKRHKLTCHRKVPTSNSTDSSSS